MRANFLEWGYGFCKGSHSLLFCYWKDSQQSKPGPRSALTQQTVAGGGGPAQRMHCAVAGARVPPQDVHVTVAGARFVEAEIRVARQMCICEVAGVRFRAVDTYGTVVGRYSAPPKSARHSGGSTTSACANLLRPYRTTGFRDHDECVWGQ